MRAARPPLAGMVRPTLGAARHTAGAGLLEIVVATLIFSIVAIGLVEFFAKGRVWFDQEEHKRVATLLAQDALERTVSSSYADIADWNETRTVDHVQYRVSVTVEVNPPSMADMKRIWSVVTWRAKPTAADRTVSLASAVFNH